MCGIDKRASPAVCQENERLKEAFVQIRRCLGGPRSCRCIVERHLEIDQFGLVAGGGGANAPTPTPKHQQQSTRKVQRLSQDWVKRPAVPGPSRDSQVPVLFLCYSIEVGGLEYWNPLMERFDALEASHSDSK